MVRLKSGFWVSAYLRRCAVEGISAALRHRGHDSAGGVFIKIDHMNQTASLYGPSPIMVENKSHEDRYFYKIIGPCFSGDVEERIARELQFDKDLWLVEIDNNTNIINFPCIDI